MRTPPRVAFFLILLFLVQVAIITSQALAFNASVLPSAPFLKDVLKVISAKERWDPEAVRVSKVDERGARFGISQRYEFRIRVVKTVLDFRFSDDIVSWKKLRKGGGSLPDLIGGGLGLGQKRPTLGAFELEGPLELHVAGDDQLSLLLPMNTTHTGLKRVLVGEGITLEVEGAQEVSLIDPSNFGLSLNRSIATLNEDTSHFGLHGYSLCAPLLSVNLVGSASLVAYKTRDYKAYIETAFHSHNTIELLPEKCYNYGHFKRNVSILSLTSRLNLLKKLLRIFLGHRIIQHGAPRFLKAKVTSSTLVKFQLELERDIAENDRIWKKVPDWKTKPALEQVRFEIVARIEAGRGLKPVSVKKLMSPFIAVDSAAWSNLMSNISFTLFPSLVVPPEALTLDVKW